ncbi:MAG: hypothetical protein HY905_27215 [Deltaproteobacteria bacterium]|nr:hypothetical protein [Deltaproteobacteria bacterium]
MTASFLSRARVRRLRSSGAGFDCAIAAGAVAVCLLSCVQQGPEAEHDVATQPETTTEDAPAPEADAPQPPDDAGSVADAEAEPDIPPGPPPELVACDAPLAWDACRVVVGPVRVTDPPTAFPDIAWTGSVFLVSAMGGRAGLEPGHVLAVVRPDGEVTAQHVWPEMAQYPRVVMNPALGVALATHGNGVRWLDVDAEVLGEASWTARETDHPEAAATPGGFLLLSGTGSYECCSPEPLRVAHLGATPGPIEWEALPAAGPRSQAEHAVGDDGLASWVVSAAWDAGPAEAYPVLPSGRLGLPTDITFPGLADVLGAAVFAGALWVLRAESPYDDGRRYLQQPGSTRPPLPLPLGNCWGPLESVGDTLVLVRDCWEEGAGTFPHWVELQAVDRFTGALIGSPIVPAPADADFVRATRTPRGLGLVWADLSAVPLPDGGFLGPPGIAFARIDCCPE